MLDLLCPVCGGRLVRKEKAWRCENHHCFDVARSGYVNLLPPSGVRENAMATTSAWSRRARRFYRAAIMTI